MNLLQIYIFPCLFSILIGEIPLEYLSHLMQEKLPGFSTSPNTLSVWQIYMFSGQNNFILNDKITYPNRL